MLSLFFGCPCGYTQVGACLLTWCAYSALWSRVFFGANFATVLAQAEAGNFTTGMTVWATLAALGLYWFLYGVREALSHDDPFRLGSFLWSMFWVALLGDALWSWTIPGSTGTGSAVLDNHIARAFVAGLFAFEAANIWLELRGSIRRLAAAAPRRRAAAMAAIPEPRAPLLRRRRRVTTEWLDELEGRGIEGLPLHALLARETAVHTPARVSPDLIWHGGALPQIVYVKEGDTFIPVQLPDAVPVSRRLR